jgi:hypothetical protein
MLRRLLSRLTYANVMATIAVFIALGGSSFAVMRVTGKNVPHDALTGDDITDLTSQDIRDYSLLKRDFKRGELKASSEGVPGPQGPKGDAGGKGDAGAQGLKGAKGDAGEKGATGLQGSQGVTGIQGSQGVTGTTGPKGDPGPLLNVLPSHATEFGNYYALNNPAPAGAFAVDVISYQFPLPSVPADHYLPPGAAPTAECPGSAVNPQAAPGHLCVYSEARANVQTTYSTDGMSFDKKDRFGFAVNVVSSGTANVFYDVGSWAVTAP